MKIKKEMLISEIFEKFPGQKEKLAEVMYEKGLHCVGCALASYETLEQGCKVHGLSEEEMKGLLKELNQIIKK